MEKNERDLLIELKSDMTHIKSDITDIKARFVDAKNNELVHKEIFRRVSGLEKARDWGVKIVCGAVLTAIVGLVVVKQTGYLGTATAQITQGKKAE